MAMNHPFAEIDSDHPLYAARAKAKDAVARLLRSDADDDWKPAYVEAWRRLDDYETSARHVASEEGLRPRRVTTQPDAVSPTSLAEPSVDDATE
jgi:hypothetical protein